MIPSTVTEIDYNVKRKLEKFLDDKLRKIFEETRDDKPALDLSYIKTEKGFENSIIQNNYGGGYVFSNSNNCCCYLYFNDKKKKKLISIAIDDIGSLHKWYGTVEMLYRCMDEINEIAKEFRQLKCNSEKQEKIHVEKQVKQEKINEIYKNSAHTWLKTLMKNQPYSYYTTEDKNKITLSIKMKNNMQLDIPVYHNKFQKIIPKLSETIQQFEKTISKSNIRVLISDSRPNQQWITK